MGLPQDVSQAVRGLGELNRTNSPNDSECAGMRLWAVLRDSNLSKDLND